MVIDMRGFLAGLMLPLAFLLGFLDRWVPALRFSFEDYREENGSFPRRKDPSVAGLFVDLAPRVRRQRERWDAGFALGILCAVSGPFVVAAVW